MLPHCAHLSITLCAASNGGVRRTVIFLKFVLFFIRIQLLLQKKSKMETLIVRYDNSNRAIKQVLDGLKRMGAIVVEKSIYNEDFVKKIDKGDSDLNAGKGVSVNLESLWK